ncbi:MAG: HD domain-containing phosphohydrolase [Campylobacterota bacterium]|nr:HD domain-containing phosphohydrolase [Campylobacterota bacterium]
MFEDFEMHDLAASRNNENIDINREQLLLEARLDMLKTFKPNIYATVHSIGTVSKAIGEMLNIREAQFYLAGYYANFGILSVEKLYKKDTVLLPEERDIIKMHSSTSMDFLLQQELNIAAEIVYYHHEFPSGKGYHRAQKLRYEEAYYIHMAELFVESIIPKRYRPGYNREMAIEWALEGFGSIDRIISKERIRDIKEILDAIELPELGVIR